MMVMKNSEQAKYTFNIYIIKTYITQENSSLDDPKFGKFIIDEALAELGGLQLIEDYLNQKSLNQGLVQVKFIYDIKTNKPFTYPLKRESLIKDSKNHIYKSFLRNESTMEVNSSLFLDYISLKISEKYKYLLGKRGIFLFLTSLTSGDIGGCAKMIPLDNKNCIIYKSNLSDLVTYAHEIAHVLGLDHTFPDSSLTLEEEIIELKKAIKEATTRKENYFKEAKSQYDKDPALKKRHEGRFDEPINKLKETLSLIQKNPYKFFKETTENIMDYSFYRNMSFNKWQWKVIQDEVKKYYNE